MKKGLEVREENGIKLIVSHLDKELIFNCPAKGPDTYANVQKQITQDKLTPPTAAEIASLVHAAWQNPDEKYSKKIIELLRTNYLWCFTGNLYVPNKGVYVQDNPKVKDGKVSMNREDLEKRLESNDSSVRFVPFGFKIGEQSALKLVKNPWIIALVGEEGAEKLAEVSDKYKYKPYVWSFENVGKETAKVSELGSGWGWYCGRLRVGGFYFDDYRYGYAFGVSGDAEGVEKNSEKEETTFVNPFEDKKESPKPKFINPFEVELD